MVPASSLRTEGLRVVGGTSFRPTLDSDDEDDDGNEDDDEEDSEDETGARPIALDKVKAEEFERLQTGIAPLDSLLNGGFVCGHVVILTGDPGVGKSTALLQFHRGFARDPAFGGTYYVTAEERPQDIKIRAKRIKVPMNKIRVARCKDIVQIIEAIDFPVEFFALDSLQKMRHPDVNPRDKFSTMEAVMDEVEQFTREQGCVTIWLSRINSKGETSGTKDVEHDGDATIKLRFMGKSKKRGEGMTAGDDRRIFEVEKNRGGKSSRHIQATLTDKGFVFE